MIQPDFEGRWLVTGGAGFIGNNFIRYFLDRYPRLRILVLDKFTYAGNRNNLPIKDLKSGRLEVFEGDVSDANLVTYLLKSCSTVVHFAAETHVTRSIFDCSRFVETDIYGTQNLLMSMLADESPHLFFHISTSEVYGSAITESMDEEHPLNPMSPYAAAKTGADRLVFAFHQTYHLPVVTVRPFNNFGPRQHLEKVIPRFVTSALTGSELRVHGDGSARRDFIFVEDTCAAINALMNADVSKIFGETFNIASGVDRSISEIALDVLSSVPNSPSSLISIEDRPGQVVRHTGDTTKLKHATGWEAQWSFSDALQATIDWYRSNEPWWRSLWSSREIAIRTREGNIVYH